MKRIKNIALCATAAALAALLISLPLFISAQRSSLQAFNDTIDLYPNIPVVCDILANDFIPAGDTIRYITVGGVSGQPAIRILVGKVSDSTWKWKFTFTLTSRGFNGNAWGKYLLRAVPFDTATGQILYRIHDRSFSYININNVRARLNSAGDHFFYENAEFEVPKGSGKTSVFCNTFWIGGRDAQHQIHFAGYRYGQGPNTGPAHSNNDFFSGPMMDSANYSVVQDTLWYRIWNLKKSDIDYHRIHCWDPGYTPIPDILTWPGNGDTALGQAYHLAPFSDRNANGKYEPYDGDYPEIRGDQALFFIFNDDAKLHTETEGLKLGIEVHGMAYAFDLPNDTALKNTVFLNYKIFNRSQNTYDSTYLGLFTDIDLGYAMDDFVRCDVERNLFIGYNGTPVDGTGQSYAYGEHPPAQGVTILAGPYMDPDGIDNPRTSNTGSQLCDYSVNGMNFGDTVVDNERLGMTGFVYINNSNAGVPNYMTDPLFAQQYYALLTGLWKDTAFIYYGGNGHPSTGGYGPACRFMFPGLTDSTNWGTGCTLPNGPVEWTEEVTGNNPSDRRGVQASGPFTFHPGDVQEIDLAFNWARSYTGSNPLASIVKLQQLTDHIQTCFRTNRLPGGNIFYGVNDRKSSSATGVSIHPNPASGRVTVALTGFSEGSTTVELQTLLGKTLISKTLTGDLKTVTLRVDGLPEGMYLVKVSDQRHSAVKKVLVQH